MIQKWNLFLIEEQFFGYIAPSEKRSSEELINSYKDRRLQLPWIGISLYRRPTSSERVSHVLRLLSAKGTNYHKPNVILYPV